MELLLRQLPVGIRVEQVEGSSEVEVVEVEHDGYSLEQVLESHQSELLGLEHLAEDDDVVSACVVVIRNVH